MATLEEALSDYPGTLLVVTHDRWFLDRVATSVLAFEDGRVTQYQGGYSDYLARYAADKRAKAKTEAAAEPAPKQQDAPPSNAETKAKKPLTYAEEKELGGLLERVDDAETRVAALEKEAGGAAFYDRSDEDRKQFFEDLEAAQAEAEALALRWSELEDRRDG